MEKTKPKKSLRRGLVTKGILVLLSLIILIFIVSFAWFIADNPNASADGISAKTSGSANFEYAIGFYNSKTAQIYKVSDWIDSDNASLDLHEIEVTGDEMSPYNILEDYQPIDITGDGSTLIKPAMEYMNKQVDQNDNNFSYAEPNVQYVTFDLIFRTNSPGIKIALDKGCYVKGNWESLDDKNTLKSSDPAVYNLTNFNVAPYSGNGANPPVYTTAFSKDAIVGAVRMSFVDFKDLSYSSSDRLYILNNTDKTSDTALYNDNCKQYPEVLWNPRPELCLNPDAEESMKNWTLTDNETSPNTDGFSYSNDGGQTTTNTSTFDHTYYQIFEGRNNSSDGPRTFNTIHPGNTTYNLVNDPEGKVIATTGNTAINNQYYGKVKVNIWVEGCDKEARRALSGGKFVFHLALLGSQ